MTHHVPPKIKFSSVCLSPFLLSSPPAILFVFLLHNHCLFSRGLSHQQTASSYFSHVFLKSFCPYLHGQLPQYFSASLCSKPPWNDYSLKPVSTSFNYSIQLSNWVCTPLIFQITFLKVQWLNPMLNSQFPSQSTISSIGHHHSFNIFSWRGHTIPLLVFLLTWIGLLSLSVLCPFLFISLTSWNFPSQHVVHFSFIFTLHLLVILSSVLPLIAIHMPMTPKFISLVKIFLLNSGWNYLTIRDS